MILSLRQKLAFVLFGIFLCSYGLTLPFVLGQLENQARGQVRRSLESQGYLLNGVLSPSFIRQSSREALHALTVSLADQIRADVAFYDAEGGMAADSASVTVPRGAERSDERGEEIEKALLGRSWAVTRRSPVHKETYFYSAVPLRDKAKIYGVLRISVPEGRITDSVRGAYGMLFVILLAGSSFAAGIGFWWGSRLARPLKQLTDAVEKFGRGDFSSMPYADASVEYRGLSDALNQMGEALSARFSDMDRDKAHTAAILNHMTDGVVAVNRDRQIVLLNPSAERILNLDGKQVLGRSLVQVMHHAAVDDMVRRGIETGQTVAREVRLSHLAGKTIRASAVSVPGGSEDLSAVLVLSDVTEIKKLEKMRKEFVANVSHELRTPLTSLQGFIETMLAGAVKDTQRSESFLKMMQEDSRRLTRLVDDLLELSKIETQDTPLRTGPVDLAAELRQLISTFQPLMAKKRITAESRVELNGNAEIIADRDRLRQVMINLMDNAVKFNREGGKIVLEVHPASDDKVEISIQDSGPGIPVEMQPRIFERFFRVDKARSRDAGGTGLGLAIVKHIVEAHGEKIRCMSRLGEGTRFIFTMPRKPIQ